MQRYLILSHDCNVRLNAPEGAQDDEETRSVRQMDAKCAVREAGAMQSKLGTFNLLENYVDKPRANGNALKRFEQIYSRCERPYTHIVQAASMRMNKLWKLCTNSVAAQWGSWVQTVLNQLLFEAFSSQVDVALPPFIYETEYLGIISGTGDFALHNRVRHTWVYVEFKAPYRVSSTELIYQNCLQGLMQMYGMRLKSFYIVNWTCSTCILWRINCNAASDRHWETAQRNIAELQQSTVERDSPMLVKIWNRWVASGIREGVFEKVAEIRVHHYEVEKEPQALTDYCNQESSEGIQDAFGQEISEALIRILGYRLHRELYMRLVKMEMHLPFHVPKRK